MRTLFALLVFLQLLACSRELRSQDTTLKTRERLVLAYYSTDWGTPEGPTGQWTRWSDGGHLPDEADLRGWRDLASARHPIDGPYDSLSPATIQRHVRLASQVGIDAWVSTWRGQGGRDDRALAVLLEELKLIRSRFRICASVEFSAGDVESLVRDLSFLVQTYGDHPNYLRHAGKPVVFVSSRVVQGQSGAEWAEILNAVRSEHECLLSADTEDAELIELFGAGHSASFLNHSLSDESSEHAKSYVKKCRARQSLSAIKVSPGYGTSEGDARRNDARSDDDRSNGIRYQNLWEVARRADPDWILLDSFNAWNEGSEIEPSREHGYFYLRETAFHAARFRQKSFPARLLVAGMSVVAAEPAEVVARADRIRDCHVLRAAGSKSVEVQVTASNLVLVSSLYDDTPATPAGARFVSFLSATNPIDDVVLAPGEEIHAWTPSALLHALDRGVYADGTSLRAELNARGRLSVKFPNSPKDGRGRSIQVIANTATPFGVSFRFGRHREQRATTVSLVGDSSFAWREGQLEVSAGAKKGTYPLKLVAKTQTERGVIQLESDFLAEVVEAFQADCVARAGELVVTLKPRIRLLGDVTLRVGVGDRESAPTEKSAVLKSGSTSTTVSYALSKLVDLRSSAPRASDIVLQVAWPGGALLTTFLLDVDLLISRGVQGAGLSHVGASEPGDGGTSAVTAVGRTGRRSLEVRGTPTYFYFDVDDRFLGGGPLVLEIDYLDRDAKWIEVQYDSADASLPDGGKYKPAERVEVGSDGRWKTARVILSDPKFTGRQSYNADFRLRSGGPLMISRVRLTHAEDAKPALPPAPIPED